MSVFGNVLLPKDVLVKDLLPGFSPDAASKFLEATGLTELAGDYKQDQSY